MQTYKLSNQAIGSIMLTLQKGILEQVDITEVLQSFELVAAEDEIIVQNPPTFQVDKSEDKEPVA
jgi:hypothetical protein|tara:strand:+ start:99 stop:293 length:195 start_codon:yes stop_codon:yes gene_type:complete